jgi:ribosomal silencing factor RsfS
MRRNAKIDLSEDGKADEMRVVTTVTSARHCKALAVQGHKTIA